MYVACLPALHPGQRVSPRWIHGYDWFSVFAKRCQCFSWMFSSCAICNCWQKEFEMDENGF